MKDSIRKIWKWIGLIWIIGFFSFMVYDFVVNAPKAQLVQNQLENEFKSIQALPNASACCYEVSHKPRQAMVGSKYSTNASYADIRNYYDAELSKHGWHFVMEEGLRDWGRDFGGKIARYCKGDYSVSIEYFGKDRDSYGADYALDLSWGLHDCK